MTANAEEVELGSFSDDDDNDAVVNNNGNNNAPTNSRSVALARLQNARLRLNEARKRNHQQVIEENKRSRVDANAEAKEKRRQWREKQEELKKEAAERGLDPERAKLLNTTAANAERQTRAQGDKKYFEWDMFNDDAQFRHHKKLVNKSLPNAKKPRTAAAADDDDDDNNNAADADALTAAAHVSAAQADDADAAVALDPALNASLGRSSVPREQALNRLVDTLHASAEKRAQFSRRRTEHEEADVDYINSKNKIFNKKLAKGLRRLQCRDQAES